MPASSPTKDLTQVTTTSSPTDPQFVIIDDPDGTPVVRLLPLEDAEGLFGDGSGEGGGGSDVEAASETVAGIVELATTAEAVTGTDTVRAVTPAGLQAARDEDEATNIARALTWQPLTAYSAGTFVSNAGNLYTVNEAFTSPSVFNTEGLTLFDTSGAEALNRANHTGSQTASTVSDFDDAAQAAFLALPSGTAAVGQVAVVGAIGPVSLEWSDIGPSPWQSLGNLGSTETISTHGRFVGTANTGCTITITLANDDQADLIVTQDATGGRTLTFSDVDTWMTEVPDTAAAAPLSVERFRFEAIDGVTYGYWVTAPVPEAEPPGSPLYGTGVDGDATITGATTLSSDVFYDNLTIDPGGSIDTNGFRLFVRGTLTHNGTISCNGTSLSTGTTGGAGTSGSGVVGNGSGGATGTTGAGADSTSKSDSLGGQGGTGGSGGSGAGGAGGTVGTPTAARGGAFWWNSAFNAITGTGATDRMATRLGGASGGGAGAGDGADPGGGGGGGGGIVVVCCRYAAGTGTIEARGGTGSSRSTGNVGGGGGGGGGVVVFITGSSTNPYTISVAGGAGGTGNGTGTAGATGASGRTYEILGAV
jgi:hypothetical protein